MSEGEHIETKLSTRNRQNLNRNRDNPCIIHPDEVDFSIHLVENKTSENAGTDSSVFVEVNEYHIDRLNKGMVARLTQVSDSRISTLVIEPERVSKRF